jgi:hypothetical protein
MLSLLFGCIFEPVKRNLRRILKKKGAPTGIHIREYEERGLVETRLFSDNPVKAL